MHSLLGIYVLTLCMPKWTSPPLRQPFKRRPKCWSSHARVKKKDFCNFISYTLPEVFAVADRIVVLRKGEKVADCPTQELTTEEAVKLMVG
jgi:hypothetical protein